MPPIDGSQRLAIGEQRLVHRLAETRDKIARDPVSRRAADLRTLFPRENEFPFLIFVEAAVQTLLFVGRSLWLPHSVLKGRTFRSDL